MVFRSNTVGEREAADSGKQAGAIQEARPIPGLQIHRSHWVALEAIRDIALINGRYVVDTMAGSRLPVSRSYLPDLRAAGLLPRR